MAYRPKSYAPIQKEEEFVSVKQQEALARQKQECAAAMVAKLQAIPTELQDDLIRSREHALLKFPRFPRDVSVWRIAYYEDWMRKADEAEMLAGSLQSDRSA
jgi:hypothetical protein